MKKTISESDFIRAFEDYGRSEQFTRQGLKNLYDYITEYEEDTGTEVELDVIALCCEYTEYDSINEYNSDYGTDYKTAQEVEQDTQVIHSKDYLSFIIQDY